VAEAGADAVHVDAMDSESVIRDVVTVAQSVADGGSSLTEDPGNRVAVIANNEVRGRESVHEYLRYGADGVSVGRPSTDRRVVRGVREALVAWGEGDREQSAGADGRPHEDAEVSP
jgi:tRNA-dihydrouridine synthase